MRSCNKFVKAPRAWRSLLDTDGPGSPTIKHSCREICRASSQQKDSVWVCSAVQVAGMRLRALEAQSALKQLPREEVPSCAGCEVRKNSLSQLLILCSVLFL